jgi:hypothetical protein
MQIKERNLSLNVTNKLKLFPLDYVEIHVTQISLFSDKIN